MVNVENSSRWIEKQALRLGRFVSEGKGRQEFVRVPARIKLDPNELFLDCVQFREKVLRRPLSHEYWRKLGGTQYPPSAIDIYFLTRFEARKVRGANRSPFWCGSTLAALSPTFRKTLEVGERLRIPIMPTMCTAGLLSESFDPFGGVLHYPGIRDQLEWQVNRDIDPIVGRELVAMMAFNFGYHHDLLHIVFSILIPQHPARDEREDYFLFLEALVFLYEFYISEEIGAGWIQFFTGVNMLYRSYDHARLRRKVPQDKRLFLGLLTTYLGSLRLWSREKMKKTFPAWAPYVDNPDVTFHEQFSVMSTGNWLKGYKDTPYPKAYRNWDTGAFPRLRLKSYRLEHLLRNEDDCEKLWDWSQQVMGNRRRGR